MGRFVKSFFKVEHDACSDLLFVQTFGDMLVQLENVVLTAVFLSEAGLAVCLVCLELSSAWRLMG